MRRTIAKKHLALKSSGTALFTIPADSDKGIKTMTIDCNDFATTIDILIVFFNSRGNNMPKILGAMQDGPLRNMLDRLQTAFEIKKNVAAAKGKPNVITLSRIGSCFSSRSVLLSAVGAGRDVVSFDDLDLEYIPHKLTFVDGVTADVHWNLMLTNPVLSSRFSDECIEMGMHYVTFKSSIKFCMKLQPNKDIDYTQQWSIYSNSLNS